MPQGLETGSKAAHPARVVEQVSDELEVERDGLGPLHVVVTDAPRVAPGHDGGALGGADLVRVCRQRCQPCVGPGCQGNLQSSGVGVRGTDGRP